MAKAGEAKNEAAGGETAGERPDGGETPTRRGTARQRRPRLTAAACDRFLGHLAETGHVPTAATAAGVTERAIYHRRQRDAAFALGWRQAVLAGYDRIEAALIRKALGLAGHAPVADGPAGEGELDVELALQLLRRHAPVVERAIKETKAAAFRATRDAAEETLLRKIRAYARTAGIEAPFAQAALPAPADGGAADHDGTVVELAAVARA